jgi:hypothetical protein
MAYRKIAICCTERDRRLFLEVHCNSLWAACEKGDLTAAVAAAALVGSPGVRANSNLALLLACGSGNKVLVEHLVETYDLEVSDVRTNDSAPLRRACEKGHLPIAIWLARRFGLTAADGRAKECGALRFAAGNGHLALVIWLVDHFGLTPDDVRIGWWDAACRAYVGGHMAIIGWLAGRFGLSAVDPRVHRCKAIRELCYIGRLDTLVWIDSMFGLTPQDAREVTRDYLTSAIYAGHGLPILKWIYLGSAEYCAAGANGGDQPLLAAACASNSVDVMAWLLATYPVLVDVAGAIQHADCVAKNFAGQTTEDKAKAGSAWLRQATKS